MEQRVSLVEDMDDVAFYAPEYRLLVEGAELDPATKGDVLDLKVTMDLENLTSFEMTIANWDDTQLAFKYSDTTTFDIGKRVHIQMGYADRIVSMMRGLITSLKPKFPESGSPTLKVSGLDALFCLRDSKPADGETKRYSNQADWQIAEAVAQRNGLQTELTREGEVHELVVQKNQDDAQFLIERAKRIDFDCFIRTDPDSGEDVLHFVKPTDGREAGGDVVYEIEWGKSLINFTPKLTVSKQVQKITVRGWDPRTKSAISYTAEAEDLPRPAGATGDSGPDLVARCLSAGSGGKQDVTVDAPVASEQEARELAISLLRERAYEFITGSGQIIGLPDLRPGQNVELLGLGTRFSGRYYVLKVEHSLTSTGFITNFDVRRAFDGGTA